MPDSLLPQLKRLRAANTNYQNRKFVSEISLYRLMQKDSIRAILANLGTEPYHLDELVEKIFKRARKVFAILLLVGHGEAISAMDKHDGLDAKLPLTEGRLEEILGDAILASDFYEKQWEFITPIFSRTLLPRLFESETILPFLAQDFNGKGHFGDVFRYDIHLENQRFARGQQVRF